MKKDSALRIRLDQELHQQFLEICKAQDKPAAQVLREFMRSYVQRHKEVLDLGVAGSSDGTNGNGEVTNDGDS